MYIISGEGNGTTLQYSCLENPMDGRAWWAAVYGVAKSRTRLSAFTFTFHSHALEKEMATHSSVLAWRIPGTGEPGRLPSMGSHRVGHDWSDLAAAAYIISIPNKNIFQKLKQNKHIFRKIKPFYQQTNKKGNTKSLFFFMTFDHKSNITTNKNYNNYRNKFNKENSVQQKARTVQR